MNNGQDNHLGEAVSPSPEIQGLPIFDRIKSAGILLTPEEQKNIETSIQESPELLTAMERDISVIATNPSEKTRFETLYLKGYGQRVILKDGRVMSFGDIGKLSKEEKAEVLGGLKRSEKSAYYEYELQAANQRKIEEKNGYKAANQEGKELDKQLIEMDGKLKSQVEDLQKIDGVPKPDIEDLKKTAQNIPELKGVNPEDIKLGKYNNILFADFYVRNSSDITKGLNPDNAKKFQESIESLSKTLGREQFEGLITNKLLGPDREKIESRGRELIEKGYNKEVVWNPADRTITFTNKNGDIRVIETARIPPREAIEKNGLRIGRDITPVSREQQEISILTQDVAKITTVLSEKTPEKIATITGVDTSMIDEQTQDGKAPAHRQVLERYTQTKESLMVALSQGSPTERLAAIKQMQQENQSLDNTRRELINTENMSNPKHEILETALWNEKESLTYLETLYQPLVDKTARINTIESSSKDKKTDTTFESDAAYNLNFLSYIGYDALGQDGLERVIERLNSSNNPRRDETGEIDLAQKLDTPKTQALTLAIANLVRGGREVVGEKYREQQKQEQSQKTWDNVDRSDHIIAARQTQSFGFRDSLISVRRNMTQEGGSLKRQSQLDKALFGIESDPEENSAINTIGKSGTSLA